ncbi:bifunctional WD40 repeat/WD40-repeat-containing domain superfamily/WD40-YVTN repeat-like-containing domain superfamily/U3 small nucleolar RNA-associated protein 4 [Babesia duncani]|uniref:Bifunctional WD40 repeat/WD40-repeat-containing domain superfamily/WD40-YVTN repeat-like-containing domain superfamily/U3 small nucleolar RNA-associated protein 4 n=1 Tax=Babesia duncani TaxID=323732 RepID=A0AAD9PKM2_9APIC|nr:bifunctional WD40 repeat/WD40-repeat-containing domain superfamily/WD40-YVTN repeat-like-containing domain superfamily/U3 small nucleolar RNA-associated protein 4 [Babesia duncani]
MPHRLSLIKIFEPTKFTVDALSFSPCGCYIAAACQHRVVEIYDVENRVHIASLCESEKDARVRCIIWVPKVDKAFVQGIQKYRLLTVGLHGVITDWDLFNLSVLGSSSSYGGAIFSAVLSNCKNRIVVSCDDGCFRSFTLWSSLDPEIPELAFEKASRCHSNSLLSICSLPGDSFATGTSDSLIFIHDMKHDQVSYKLRVPCGKTQGVKTRHEHDDHTEHECSCTVDGEHGTVVDYEFQPCQVWSLAYMNKHNLLISGDSLGNVILWDINTRTMFKLFTQHASDVVFCGIELDGNSFISAGVDGKISFFLYNENNIENEQRSVGWYLSGVKYRHRGGDISCMAMHPKEEIVAISGGDMVISLSKELKEPSNKNLKPKLILLGVPSWITSSVVMNDSKTLAICKYSQHAELWSLYQSHAKVNQSKDDSNTEIDLMPQKVALLKLSDVDGHIKNAAISPNGEYIALTKQQSIFVYKFDINKLEISPQKINISDMVIYCILFLSNEQLICSCYSSKFQLLKIDVVTGDVAVLFEDINICIDVPILKFQNCAINKPMAAFGMDGSAYLVNVNRPNIIKLPNFDNGSRIVAVAAHRDTMFVAVFSSWYKYYFYNLQEGKIALYNGELLHSIPNKIINKNAQIYNVVWFSNKEITRLLVQTTNCVLSIKINMDLFNVQEQQLIIEKSQSIQHILTSANQRKYVYIGPRRHDCIPTLSKCLYQPPVLYKRSREELERICNSIKSVENRNRSIDLVKEFAIIKKKKFLIHFESYQSREDAEMYAFPISPPKDSIFHRKRYGK